MKKKVDSMKTYEKFCEELKKCYSEPKCIGTEKNPIICACRMVRKWVNGDKDKLLELKAESRCLEAKTLNDSIITKASLVMSVIAILCTIVISIKECNQISIVLDIGAAVVLMIYAILTWVLYHAVAKAEKIYRKKAIWYQYMNIAIEEVEKEMEKKDS